MSEQANIKIQEILQKVANKLLATGMTHEEVCEQLQSNLNELDDEGEWVVGEIQRYH